MSHLHRNTFTCVWRCGYEFYENLSMPDRQARKGSFIHSRSCSNGRGGRPNAPHSVKCAGCMNLRRNATFRDAFTTGMERQNKSDARNVLVFTSHLCARAQDNVSSVIYCCRSRNSHSNSSLLEISLNESPISEDADLLVARELSEEPKVAPTCGY